MKSVIGGASEFAFPELNEGEKIERRERGGEFNGGVEERRGARRAVDGGCFVNPGSEERQVALVKGLQAIFCSAEEFEAVIEV